MAKPIVAAERQLQVTGMEIENVDSFVLKITNKTSKQSVLVTHAQAQAIVDFLPHLIRFPEANS